MHVATRPFVPEKMSCMVSVGPRHTARSPRRGRPRGRPPSRAVDVRRERRSLGRLGTQQLLELVGNRLKARVDAAAGLRGRARHASTASAASRLGVSASSARV